MIDEEDIQIPCISRGRVSELTYEALEDIEMNKEVPSILIGYDKKFNE